MEDRRALAERARSLSLGGRQPPKPAACAARPRGETVRADGDQTVSHPRHRGGRAAGAVGPIELAAGVKGPICPREDDSRFVLSSYSRSRSRFARFLVSTRPPGRRRPTTSGRRAMPGSRSVPLTSSRGSSARRRWPSGSRRASSRATRALQLSGTPSREQLNGSDRVPCITAIATKLLATLALLGRLILALEPNPTMGDTGLEP